MSDDDRIIRMSSLPRLARCAQSGQAPSRVPHIERRNSDANLGSAIHLGLARLIETGEWPSIDAIMERYGIDESEREAIESSFGYAASVWSKHFRDLFPSPLVEQQVRSPTLSKLLKAKVIGHVDLISVFSKAGSRVGRILDWKTLYGGSDYWDQQRGYALATAEEYGLDHVECVVVHTALGWFDVQHFTRDALDAWAHELAERVTQKDAPYSPGAHCRYCPRDIECDARREMVRGVMDTITPTVERRKIDLTAIYPELVDPARRHEAGPTVEHIRAVVSITEDAIAQIKEQLKEAVSAHGPIPLPNGKVYGFRFDQRKESDAAAIREFLIEAGSLTAGEIDSVAKLSVSTLLDLIGRRAPRGETKHAKEAALADWIARGLVKVTEQPKLVEMKVIDEASQ